MKKEGCAIEEIRQKISLPNSRDNFDNFNLSCMGRVNEPIQSVLRNESGAIKITLTTYLSIFVFFTFTFILAVQHGCIVKSRATYQHFGAAMNYAAQAANMDGNIELVALRQADAEMYFKQAMADMYDGYVNGNYIIPGDEYIPGNIRLISFRAIAHGEQVPGGIAQQPGYIAKVEIPILKAEIPLVGFKYLTVEREYFAVVKSTTNYSF